VGFGVGLFWQVLKFKKSLWASAMWILFGLLVSEAALQVVWVGFGRP
jgi:hypothetical protein